MQTHPADQTVYGIEGWRRFVLWPLGALLRLWGWSLRFELSPEDSARIRTCQVPVVIVLWHNRLLVGSEIYRRYRTGRKAFGLVSASRDGAWLAAFFSLLRLGSVRGSSSRLAREAAQALVQCLRDGFDVGITPDGPRGPMYDFKPGTVVVARRARAPLLLLGSECLSFWRLKTWDGFFLPKPFSRVRLRCALVEPDQVQDRDGGLELLKRLMAEINPDPPDQAGAALRTHSPGAAPRTSR